MRKELSKEELRLLAQSEKMDPNILRSVKHMLDTKIVRDKLILYEFRTQSQDRRVQKKQIIDGLVKKYQFSKSYIEKIVYRETATMKQQKQDNDDK